MAESAKPPQQSQQEVQEPIRQLAATTALHEAILNSANFAIISTDVDGVIRLFNVGAQRMLGYAAEEVVDKETPAILHDPAEVVARARKLTVELGRQVEPHFEAFVAKARSGIADEQEWTYIRKDGTRFPVMLSVTAMWDVEHRLTGFLGIAYDLTGRKKVEHMKNEFISTVSHELRTPLTSIRGSLGLLANGAVGAMPVRAAALLDIAKNNCERLVRLINDILDIEKIESGNIRFDTVTQRMLPLVEQALGATQHYVEQYKVKLALQPEPADAYVAVDADRIIQVMMNLLSNAAKFSPAGSTVEVKLQHLPGRLRLSVRDHGPGIDEAFRTRIFQKFAQADSSDTRKKGGTGLGLSISRAIIEKHHGRIDFHTELGAGTEFYVDLPLAGTIHEAVARTGRVLICEDDPDIAKLLGLMLLQAGLTSDVAADATQARRLLNAGSYEAMTLDIALPGEDGISLLQWMRAQEKTRSLPVVIVSAQAQQDHRHMTGGAVGVVDWIEKPIDQTRLLAALQDTIAQRKDGTPSVLHVEEDIDLVNVVAALLGSRFNVTHAATLEDARGKLAEESFNLILLDLQLPDGHGSDLLASLPARNATTPVVIFSGQEANQTTIDSVHAALVKSRTSNEQLIAIIHQLIGQAHAGNSPEEKQ